MDTLTPQADTQTQVTPDTQTQTVTAKPDTFTWKSNLTPDFANSPTMQKYADTKDGFNDAVKAHLELQKMMGHDKVPIPKSKDDPARVLFNKALGIPDKPDGYNLADADVPETMKGLTFDKKKFAEIVHQHDLTPAAAKGLWEAYTQMSKQGYADALKSHQDKMTGVINTMRQEWGDAYQSKVELGQMVINKFSGEQEVNDYITSVLSADPRGLKFLAKIGDQFSENKIGDFKYQRHSLTPDEAQRELDGILRDSNHPYNNPKATQHEHDAAINFVNSLHAVIAKTKTRQI